MKVLRTVMLNWVLCGIILTVTAQASDLNLYQISKKAGELVIQGHPRSAITSYYERYLDNRVFEKAKDNAKEIFLFEYGDACVRAADQLPATKAKVFLQTAIEISRRYIDWYGSLSDSTLEKWKTTNREWKRPSSVIFHLGAAYKRLSTSDPKIRERQLDDYEQIASDRANLFSQRSIRLWEESIRMYPDFKVTQNDTILRKLAANDFS